LLASERLDEWFDPNSKSISSGGRDRCAEVTLLLLRWGMNGYG
jgi:hypothetical protein